MRDIRPGIAGPPFATQPGLSGERGSTAIAAGAGGNVRALQAYLRNKGYALSVDGIRGPQTESAIAAYHQGISPTAWNKKSVHAGARPNVSRNVRVSRASPARRGAPVRGARTGRVTVPGRPPVPQTDPMAAAAAASATPGGGPSLTAQQLATAQVAQQFDPQIAAIQRQIAAANAAAAAQQASLKAGYGQAGETAQASADQMRQADAGFIAQQQQGTQNLLQLFGGPGANGPAGEAGAYADINNAALAQLAAANEGYNQSYVPIIATQGQEAQATASRDANQAIQELAGQLSDVQGQRGNAYTEALYRAQTDEYNKQQDELDRQQKQQALQLAQSLMPSQIKEANARANLAAQEARNAPLKARREALEFGMSMKRYQAELANTKARTAQILAGAKKNADGSIDWTDPNTRASLAKQLRPIVQGQGGQFRMHPGAAQKNLNLALAQLGIQNTPEARAIAAGILQEAVTNSHAAKKWGQFNYANGKIVKTGHRFNKKK